MNTNTEQQHLQIIAEKLKRIMAGEASVEAQEIIGEILNSMANEAGLGVDDPAIIETTFPLMIERVGLGYIRGVVHSLNAVFDSCLSEVERADALDAEVIK